MKNENHTITPFLFGENHIRTILQEGEPWFVIADVCKVLAIGNPSDAKRRLFEDGVDTIEGIDAMGRTQTMSICNESGLYCLIFQSRKAAAREFTRWVTSEVLPAIRRNGYYNNGHQAFLGLLKEQISLGVSPDIAARAAARLTQSSALPHRSGSSVADSLFHGSTMVPADDLISAMEEERFYTTDELLTLLPKTHRIHRMKPGRGRQSGLGRLLQTYVQAGTLKTDLHHGRSIFYRPRVVVEFGQS